MKTTKIITRSLLIFTVGIAFHLTVAAKAPDSGLAPKPPKTSIAKKKRSQQAKLLKQAAPTNISIQEATDAISNYLQHLITKYNLQIGVDEANNLITTTTRMIYLKAGTEEPSTPFALSDLYKIKKSFKGHLRMFHAEKFVTPKTKNTKKLALYEVPRKLAKKTIRETTKDYLINTCRITDPQEVYMLWKFVKPLVDKKLDAESYRSDYDELIVPREIVDKGLQLVYKTLTNRGIVPQKKQSKKKTNQAKKQLDVNEQPSIKKPALSRSKMARQRQPSRRPYHSRKNIERSISLKQAERMVTKQLERRNLNPSERSHLLTEIMKKVRISSTPAGFVYPQSIQHIILKEVAEFQKAQRIIPSKKTSKKRSKSSTRNTPVEVIK